MAASKTMRLLGWLVFVACVVVAGLGAWYVRGGGTPQEDEDTALDDDDDVEPSRDAGAGARPRPRPKKTKSGRRNPKGSHPAHPNVARPTGPSGMSYEAAIAGNSRQITPGSKEAPDLTDAQLAGPMRNATFLSECGVPNSTHVTVKVAIRNGRAVGVSVYSVPPNPEADSCVERRVRGLYWPSNAKMDSFVTTY